jgi:dTMP kinase
VSPSPRNTGGGEGAFIVVEGIDGSGSTTIVDRLVASMKAKQRAAHRTCEPSTGPVGSMIRQILSHRIVVPGHGSPGWATMALLFAADRLDHLQAEVMPHLRQGVMVISDRYDLSSLAYQSATAPPTGAGEGKDVVAWIRELNSRARRPDLTLVLDVTPDVAATRRGLRGGAKELYEDLDLQSRLAQAYANAERLVPGDLVVHIDANQSIDAVLAAAIAAVEEHS